MKIYLLDTSALMALRFEEAGAGRVAALLQKAHEKQMVCYGCFMTLMELTYCVWRMDGENAAKLAYQQCLSLPIQWIHETPELLWKSVEIKAKHTLSVGDAWIAACAILHHATLLHKDPEFSAVPIKQESLPFK